MSFYIEPQKEIPIVGTSDVVIVGAGPSGFAAALASARLGAETILIEQCGCIGGVSTAGLMSHWTGSSGSKIYQEILEKSSKLNEGKWHNNITVTIDPEKLKYLYLKLLGEAGVKIKLYTFLSDVIMEGNVLKGIITESKSGREAILAKRFIDCTGDGDLAYKSGAEYTLGRDEDNKMQPATLMFKVGGVDYSKAVFLNSFEDTFDTPRGELQHLGKQIIPYPAGHVLLYRTLQPGVVTCNMTNCTDIDGTNADDLTYAEIVCREQIEQIIKFLREYAPGYENCFVINSASLIGIRETRHFKGEYTITENDILEAKQFDGWITKDAHFNFDVHNITGNGLDETGVQKHFTQNQGYTIPYGCLLPLKIENLLLSGRNISGTHIAHSNFRAMPICVGIGEGGGIAAALSCKNNINLRSVNPKDIQAYL